MDGILRRAGGNGNNAPRAGAIGTAGHFLLLPSPSTLNEISPNRDSRFRAAETQVTRAAQVTLRRIPSRTFEIADERSPSPQEREAGASDREQVHPS